MSLVTKQQDVLAALVKARDGFLEVEGVCYRKWVPGRILERDDIGGRSGTRRVRELRSQGWKIEQRRHPESGEVEHALVGEPKGRTFCDICGRDPTQSLIDTTIGKELWLCQEHHWRYSHLKGFVEPGNVQAIR